MRRTLAVGTSDRLVPLQRASRLLEGQPESVEHGYLELAMAMTSSGVEDLMGHGAAMLDIGSRFNDNDLQAFGLMVQGMAHIAKAGGRTRHVIHFSTKPPSRRSGE